jgi:putative ubiquitin-RnfH superfamily antitoxin RatB of RatAB toxin-antitoxin module
VNQIERAYGKPDTHRTVTLRIPKGKTIAEAILHATMDNKQLTVFGLLNLSDTDLQKALDEVKGESNE